MELISFHVISITHFYCYCNGKNKCKVCILKCHFKFSQDDGSQRGLDMDVYI